jgi:hypothetical protein
MRTKLLICSVALLAGTTLATAQSEQPGPIERGGAGAVGRSGAGAVERAPSAVERAPSAVERTPSALERSNSALERASPPDTTGLSADEVPRRRR